MSRLPEINISEKVGVEKLVIVTYKSLTGEMPIPTQALTPFHGRVDHKDADMIDDRIGDSCLGRSWLIKYPQTGAFFTTYFKALASHLLQIAANDADDALILAEKHIAPLMSLLSSKLHSLSNRSLTEIKCKDVMYIAYRELNWNLEALVDQLTAVEQLNTEKQNLFFTFLAEPGSTITSAFMKLNAYDPNAHRLEQDRLKAQAQAEALQAKSELDVIKQQLITFGYESALATRFVDEEYQLFHTILLKEHKESLEQNKTRGNSINPVRDAVARTQFVFHFAAELLVQFTHQVPNCNQFIAHKLFLDVIQAKPFDHLFRYSASSHQKNELAQIASIIITAVAKIIRQLNQAHTNQDAIIAELRQEISKLIATNAALNELVRNLQGENAELRAMTITQQAAIERQADVITKQAAEIERLKAALAKQGGKLPETATIATETMGLFSGPVINPRRIDEIKQALLARVNAYREQVRTGLTAKQYEDGCLDGQNADVVFENLPCIVEALSNEHGARHLFIAFRELCEDGWRTDATAEGDEPKHFGYHCMNMTLNGFGIFRTVCGDSFDTSNPLKSPAGWDGNLTLAQVLTYFAFRHAAKPDNADAFGFNVGNPDYKLKNRDGKYQNLAKAFFNKKADACVEYHKDVIAAAKATLTKFEAREVSADATHAATHAAEQLAKKVDAVKAQVNGKLDEEAARVAAVIQSCRNPLVTLQQQPQVSAVAPF